MRHDLGHFLIQLIDEELFVSAPSLNSRSISYDSPVFILAPPYAKLSLGTFTGILQPFKLSRQQAHPRVRTES